MKKCTNCGWEGKETDLIGVYRNCPACGDRVEEVYVAPIEVEAPVEIPKPEKKVETLGDVLKKGGKKK
jgi:hypothetical protein